MVLILVVYHKKAQVIVHKYATVPIIPHQQIQTLESSGLTTGEPRKMGMSPVFTLYMYAPLSPDTTEALIRDKFVV